MRVSPARYMFVALIIVGLAGCNCGRCSLPSCSPSNLAFWKNRPFKSSADTTATAMGAPMKPSALASRSGMVGPGGGYAASSAGAPSTSPYIPTTTNPATIGGYPSTQQPYSPYPPTTSSYNLTATGTAAPYMAPQVGAYGAGSPAARAGASSYVNTRPYAPVAATPYGPLPNSAETTGSSGYTAANSTGPYARSLPSSPSSGGTADRYASRYDRSTDRADQLNERSDQSRSAPDRYAGGYDRSAGIADRYAPAAASSTLPLGQPGRTADPYGPIAPAAGYSDGTSSPYASGSPYPGSSPYVATPQGSSLPAGAVDRYPAGGGQGAGSVAGGGYPLSSAAPSRPRYPAAADPNAASPERAYSPPASIYPPGETGYTPGDTGYTPGNPGYTPGDPGYTPPGVSPYRSPAGPYTLPAGNPDDPPPYRPGSTSDYVPRTPTAGLPASNPSAYPGGARSSGAGVMPAEYAQPVGGLR